MTEKKIAFLVQPVCPIFHSFSTAITLTNTGSPSKCGIHWHSHAALGCAWQWEAIDTVYCECSKTSFLKTVADKNKEANTTIHT